MALAIFGVNHLIYRDIISRLQLREYTDSWRVRCCIWWTMDNVTPLQSSLFFTIYRPNKPPYCPVLLYNIGRRVVEIIITGPIW